MEKTNMKFFLFTAFILASFLLSGAEFVPGKSGQALRGRTKLVYDNKVVTPEAGSVAFWFKTDREFKEINGNMLLCLGTYAPGWFFVRLSREGLNVSFRNTKGSETTRTSLDGLKKGVWNHLAVVWGKRKKYGFCRIYINGVLKNYERLTLPEKFSSGPVAVAYNSGSWKEPGFPGELDELALFNVPLSADAVKKICEAGNAGKAFPDLPGRVLYAPFDKTTAVITGKSADPETRSRLLREAAKKVKITKYPDETDFTYSFSMPTEEKFPGSLNDGNDNTGVTWRKLKVSVTGHFDRTVDAAEIEIVTRKYTKWYLLKQLQVSWDDGSGDFSAPVVINTYAHGKKVGNKVVDESCKTYVYSVKNPGKMCRFKITPVGEGYVGINEIRIRVKR